MERIRLLRLATYIASAVCLIACGLLIALWVRSYHTADRLHGKFWGRQLFLLASKDGGLTAVVFRSHGAPGWWRWRTLSYPVDDELAFPLGPVQQYESALGFGWITNPIYMVMRSTQTLADGTQVTFWGAATATLRGGGPILPFWFLVVVSGALAGSPWVKPARRYSLRTLLIVMTLVAVVLGLVVASGR